MPSPLIPDLHSFVLRRDVAPRFRSLAATMALALLSAGCTPPPDLEGDTSMFRGGPGHSGVYAGPGIEGFGGVRWRFETGGAVRASPAVSNGVLFIGGTNGRFFAQALDGATGIELWRTPTTHRAFASPAVTGETVLFADHAGVLFALDRSSGEERWRFKAEEAIQSSPVVADGMVYLGSDDGFVYAIDGTEGPSVHRVVYGDPEGRPTLPCFEALQSHLIEAGFQDLSEHSLADFMADRVSDGEPSVVVFAAVQVPATVAATAADTVLFRRYLEAGGRVVWMGYPPFSLLRDPETGAVTGLDMDRVGEVLGVDHASASGDVYPSWATGKGRDWGLHETWLDAFSVDAGAVSTVLALDERGRATAWVQRYSEVAGGGFVRLWGRFEALDSGVVQRVAEFGLAP